ncbi:hypothetical protein EB796_008920 [Bugula neritina]|uniref:Uncharacterized protein n=1 Tax=Bugula neritina TaxID=10212 RepID=A0A7J7K2A2_BUGNE|nr:hypothetical protein EB796_008920 [Bugula neritina]
MINCGYISISFDEGGVTGARLSVYNYCRPQVAYVQYIIREKPSVFERAVAVSHRILLDKTVILVDDPISHFYDSPGNCSRWKTLPVERADSASSGNLGNLMIMIIISTTPDSISPTPSVTSTGRPIILSHMATFA